MTTNPLELAYAAGVFDGEGHIAISYHKPDQAKGSKNRHGRYSLSASMSQNNAAVIRWFHKNFGGSVRFVTGKRAYDRGVYERWNWVLSTTQAADFLLAIQPYSIVKKDEIALALEFQTSMTKPCGKRLPENVVMFRKECHIQMRAIRGTKQTA